MGFRTHVQIVDKDNIDKLHKCQTINDVKEVYSSWGYKPYDDEDTYFPVYEVPHIEEYCFGKYTYDLNDAVIEVTEDVYTSQELKDRFSEYYFRFGGEEVLKTVIDVYHQKIIHMYENLINNKSDLEYEQTEIDLMSQEEKERWQFRKLKEHIETYYTEWNNKYYKPYNEDKNNPRIVYSWLFEFSIFELVRIWKNFNPETQYVLFIGW